MLIAGFADFVAATTVGAARPWPLLTNVSLGTDTQIDSVDFVLQSLGYGISCPQPGFSDQQFGWIGTLF
jgi:hypothetical protein